MGKDSYLVELNSIFYVFTLIFSENFFVFLILANCVCDEVEEKN